MSIEFIQTKKIKSYFLLLVGTVFLIGCNDSDTPQGNSVIPKVNTYTEHASKGFDFTGELFIRVESNEQTLIDMIALSAQQIKSENPQVSNVSIINQAVDTSSSSTIVLNDFVSGFQEEEYQLDVGKDIITITAGTAKGAFYAFQTLRQLFITNHVNGYLPQATIEDFPSYSYRGLMLDVSRHFFSVEQVKKIIDLMALYKLNKLHWHLTDDQGWRIEIDQYPLLTDIGSYRPETILEKNFDPFIGDGIPHFGFYTKEEIREVVQYAKLRNIDIIPEIDVPGHSSAILAAYPEFGCTPGPYDVSTRWGIHAEILCPSEETFTFLTNILTELVDLFPYEYIHIGGDEVPTRHWQNNESVQLLMAEQGFTEERQILGYFYNRLNQFLLEKGRKAIGWDEILEVDIAGQTNVMIWHEKELAKSAIEKGHNVILTPAKTNYLNYYQGNQNTEPLAQCCLITLESAYQSSMDIEGLDESEQQKILGGQASLWSEYISTNSHMEYMLFPRLFALSENFWTKPEHKNFQQFKDALSAHLSYLEAQQVNFKPIER